MKALSPVPNALNDGGNVLWAGFVDRSFPAANYTERPPNEPASLGCHQSFQPGFPSKGSSFIMASIAATVARREGASAN
jgi:hypothetical protein